MTTSAARVAAVVALVATAPLLARFYARNERLGIVPETVAAAVTAHALVRAGTPDVAPYYPATDFPGGLLYGVRANDGRLYGIEPLASPLTFAPLFVPYRDAPPQGFRLHWRLFNTVAARLTAFTVVLLGLWLLGLVSPWRALLVTAVIALATSVRTIDAAGLWQHTSAAPWLVAGLALWSRAGQRPSLHPWAGGALAIATACRPIFVPAALLVVWSAARDRRHRGIAVATAAVVASIGALALLGNWYLHGSLLGGRAAIVGGIARTHAVASYFDFSPWNLVGLLAAPSRGLFVYSPVLLFALPGLVWTLRHAAPPPERLMTVAAAVIFLLYGFIATWWGGWVFGPRYMTDLLPFFALWLARAPLPPRRPALVALFALALAWSLLVQELGVRSYPCGWDANPVSVDQAPERLWSLSDTELERCWRKLRAPRV